MSSDNRFVGFSGGVISEGSMGCDGVGEEAWTC